MGRRNPQPDSIPVSSDPARPSETTRPSRVQLENMMWIARVNRAHIMPLVPDPVVTVEDNLPVLMLADLADPGRHSVVQQQTPKSPAGSLARAEMGKTF